MTQQPVCQPTDTRIGLDRSSCRLDTMFEQRSNIDDQRLCGVPTRTHHSAHVSGPSHSFVAPEYGCANDPEKVSWNFGAPSIRAAPATTIVVVDARVRLR